MHMQDRLVRSRTDRMLGGVCGGLARYFELDPVIVRLVAILLAMSGFGILLYFVLWLAVPAETMSVYAPPPFPQAGAQQVGQPGQDPTYSSVRVLDPSQYRFDPYTGQPIARPSEATSQSQAAPATGQTVSLRAEGVQQAADSQQQAAPPPLPLPPPQRPAGARGDSRGRLGVLLLITGAILLAGQLGIGPFVIPLVLIALGVMILSRR
jgi:phage shock protein C